MVLTLPWEFQRTENIFSYLLKAGLSVKLLQYTGLDGYIVSDPNPITRNLKRGFSFTLTRELIQELTSMNSNLRRLDSVEGWSIIALDTGANTGVSWVMEISPLLQTLDSFTRSSIGSNEIADIVVATGLSTLALDQRN